MPVWRDMRHAGLPMLAVLGLLFVCLLFVRAHPGLALRPLNGVPPPGHGETIALQEPRVDSDAGALQDRGSTRKRVRNSQDKQTTKVDHESHSRPSPSARPVRVFGHVTRSESPLNGVRIHAALEGEGTPLGHCVSDEYGAYEFVLPGSGDYVFSLLLSPENGKRTCRREHVPPVDDFELDFVLHDACITGTVAYEDGRPRASTWIVLRGAAAYDWVLSDSSGAFSFRGLDPGRYRVYSRAWDESRGGEPYAVDEPVLVSLEQHAHVHLGLRYPATLRGRVLTPKGEAVASARIVLWAGDTLVDYGRQRISDADGRFIIPNLAAGSYVASAYRGEHVVAPRTNEFVLEAGDCAEIMLLATTK
jgi:hypothetical protein